MITVRAGRIAVTQGYSERVKLAAIPGARFEVETASWTFPLSPVSAKAVAEAIPGHFQDESFRQLKTGALEWAEGARNATDLPPPAKRKTEPWQHQKQAYHFASNLPGAFMNMGVGTGKTKVAIDLIQNSPARKVLVVCTSKGARVWPWQFEEHCAVPYIITAGDGSLASRVRDARQMMELATLTDKLFVQVVNYEAMAMSPMRDWLISVTWGYVVWDEAHHLKSPGGVRSRYASMLADRSLRRLALTGTPMHHTPLDVYGQFRAVDKGVFGTSFALFRARYAVMGGYKGYQVIRYQNEDDLRKRMLAVTYEAPSSVLDLPSETHTFRTCVLNADARKVYNGLIDDFMATVGDSEVVPPNALARLLRLRQITGGHVGVEDPNGSTSVRQIDDAKEKLFGEVLEELGAEPVVVFAVFIADLEAIKRQCEEAGVTYSELSGRADGFADWKAGRARVLVCQVQSGGEALSMVEARYTIYYSMGFSLGEYQQTAGRIRRPGQTRPVTYIHLLAENTVDETVWRAVQKRENIVRAILARKYD